MRYLKNRTFQRDLKESNLDDEDIKTVLDNVFKGRAIGLGSKMYKIRASREGEGKSGGFRHIFFWKKDELIVFCLVFSKNVQDNIGSAAHKTLKMLSGVYENLTEDEIKKQIELKELMEIQYEK